MRSLPWEALMQAGLGRLRLTPDDFWALTPRELQAALGVPSGGQGAVPLDRSGLAALMTRFPDDKEYPA
jgi:uncharacterized phage protein (TIGR02216 family)